MFDWHNDMRFELIQKFEFIASHSLGEDDPSHPHLWKLELVLEGTPVQGKVTDMVELRSRIQLFLKSLEGCNLNDSSIVNASVREFPTCETLSAFFFQYTQELLNGLKVSIRSVQVGLCDLQGNELGSVRAVDH
jgi:6-pyruvoyl-tetrahydropterin synthase